MKVKHIIILSFAVLLLPACPSATDNSNKNNGSILTCEKLGTCIHDPISIGELDDIIINNNNIKNEYSQAYQKVNSSTVQIQNYIQLDSSYTPIAFYSGFIIKHERNQYYILTIDKSYGESNYYSEVILASGERYITTHHASFANSNYRLAIFTFESDKQYPVAPMDFTYQVEIGETLLAMGTPVISTSLFNTMTKGIVSGIDRQIYQNTVNDKDYFATGFQFDAPINNGVEGGPVFNKDGIIIGMAAGKVYQSGTVAIESIAVANGLKEVKKIIDSLIINKSYTAPSLGISLVDLLAISLIEKVKLRLYPLNLSIKNTEGVTEDVYAKGERIPDDIIKGVYLLNIVAAGAFDNSQITAGDIIVEFNGIRVENFVQFSNIIYQCSPGDKVVVKTYLKPDGYIVTLK